MLIFSLSLFLSLPSYLLYSLSLSLLLSLSLTVSLSPAFLLSVSLSLCMFLSPSVSSISPLSRSLCVTPPLSSPRMVFIVLCNWHVYVLLFDDACLDLYVCAYICVSMFVYVPIVPLV